MIRFLLLFLLMPAAAYAVDSRLIDRPLLRLEQKIEDARNSDKISVAAYAALRAKIENIRMMREEALADGNLSVKEKDAILQAIRTGEVDLAEAKTAPKTTLAGDSEEADIPALTGNPVPKPPSNSGSAL